MMSPILFVMTAILWGSSAIVTAHQAVGGAPEISVGYRMAVVSLVMFGWSVFSKQKLRLTGADRSWVVLQGILFFGLAFIAFYHSTRLISSGVAALVLSTSSLFAALVSRIFMSMPVAKQTIAGMLLGVFGLAVVALPEFSALGSDTQTLSGVALAMVAAACTGSGTVVALRNQRAGIPIVVLMSWAAFFGAVFSFGLALVQGISFHIDFSIPYLAGMAYLAIIASCITFFMYFSLVQRIGAPSASYTMALVPVVALLLSAIFENLALDAYLVIGGLAVFAGNILVLSNQGRKMRPFARKIIQQ